MDGRVRVSQELEPGAGVNEPQDSSPSYKTAANTTGHDMTGAAAGASARAVSIGRVIDRLCRTPGTYQISIVVPVHRRAPWQITYSRLEPLRNELVSRK